MTEYDKKATSLYGSKRSVADLWKRAEAYYDNAFEYYNKDGVVDSFVSARLLGHFRCIWLPILYKKDKIVI